MGAEYLGDLTSRPRTARRGAAALRWAVENFGVTAVQHPERGKRVAEEALEVAQGLGVDLETVIRIARRTFARARTTDVAQEMGQLQLTLELAAENYGVNLEAEVAKEWDRVRRVPAEEWKRRHDAKIADGTAT